MVGGATNECIGEMTLDITQFWDLALRRALYSSIKCPYKLKHTLPATSYFNFTLAPLLAT